MAVVIDELTLTPEAPAAAPITAPADAPRAPDLEAIEARIVARARRRLRLMAD